MPCPATEGWQQRMLIKAEVAAGAGLVGGALYAVTKRGPVISWALATSLSCTICETTFSGIQELVRAWRCEVSPLNSIIAGGLAGYLVMAAHAGKRKAAPAALVCAAVGGAADVAATWADVPHLWRRTLAGRAEAAPAAAGQQQPQQHPLEKAAEPDQQEAFPGNPEAPQYFATGTWRDWLPVRKLSEEEWAAYQRRKAEAFQRKIDRATKPLPPEEKES